MTSKKLLYGEENFEEFERTKTYYRNNNVTVDSKKYKMYYDDKKNKFIFSSSDFSNISVTIRETYNHLIKATSNFISRDYPDKSTFSAFINNEYHEGICVKVNETIFLSYYINGTKVTISVFKGTEEDLELKDVKHLIVNYNDIDYIHINFDNLIGKKVTYISTNQKGIIKEHCEDEENIFVVYNCAEKWNEFANYTGVNTKLSDLRFGWPIVISESKKKNRFQKKIKIKKICTNL